MEIEKNEENEENSVKSLNVSSITKKNDITIKVMILKDLVI